MNLTVNAATIPELPDGIQTIEDMIDALRERGHIRADEVVVELEVDGYCWRAADMDSMGSARLEGVREVAVSTTDMRGYAFRILTDAESMLRVLTEGSAHVANLMRTGPVDQANVHLFNLLNALQRFLSCLVHVQNACELSTGLLGSSEDVLAGLSASLESVQQHQEASDWVGVAERLESDLVPALGALHPVLDGMRGEL